MIELHCFVDSFGFVVLFKSASDRILRLSEWSQKRLKLAVHLVYSSAIKTNFKCLYDYIRLVLSLYRALGLHLITQTPRLHKVRDVAAPLLSAWCARSACVVLGLQNLHAKNRNSSTPSRSSWDVEMDGITLYIYFSWVISDRSSWDSYSFTWEWTWHENWHFVIVLNFFVNLFIIWLQVPHLDTLVACYSHLVLFISYHIIKT